MNIRLVHGIPLLALAAAIQDANAIVVNPDNAQTLVNAPVEINVLANDELTIAGYGGLAILQFDSGSEAGGVVSESGGGLRYTPPENFEGTDTFTYWASDLAAPNGASAVVTVVVRAAPDGGDDDAPEDSLESAVSGANNKQTARVLDNLCEKVSQQQTDGISQDLVEACGQLATTDKNMNDIVSQITPGEVLVMRRMMSNVSQAQTQRVFQQQNALRTGNRPAVVVSGGSLNLQGYLGGAAGEEQNSRWGLFGSVHSDNADHDDSGYEAEYEMSGMGATAGVDYRFSPGLVAGVALDWSTSEVKYARHAGNVESDTLSFTSFLTWYMAQFSVDAQLGYGRADFDSRRNISFPFVAVAAGSTSSDQINFSLQGDWTWSHDALTLRPFLRVDLVSSKIDGYTESSASPWAMRVGSQDVEQTTSSLGLDTRYAFSFDWGVLVPGLSVSAVSEASSDYDPVRFQLVGTTLPDGAFALQPDTEDSLYYQYDLSTVFVLKNGWSTYLAGQFISGFDNYSTYVVSAGLRMEL